MTNKKHFCKSLSLYQQLELMIMDWSNNGTKTAGKLTRKILRVFVVRERIKKTKK